MATAWGYGKADGPSTWAKQFPAARGAEQSPIRFRTSDAQFSTALTDTPLTINYRPEQALKLGNTGASIKADCSLESNTLTGGPLGQKVYRLAQFHLHWGAQDDRGAEHIINDKVYAAELHLVHWNSTDYASFDKAVDQKDGLAVLCVFIEVGGSGHQGFEAVSSQLDKTSCKGDNYTLTQAFDPTCLLPSNTKHFWTYHGSLTTPPCYESVQFILFEDPLQFSQQQMTALRSLHVGDQKSAHMVDNFRPPCTLGNRCVLSSFTK